MADALEGEVKASWRVEKALDKNVNCLLYVPAVSEVWSCGDTDLLYVWKENIWVGKRGVAALEGHRSGSKVFAMTSSKSNCQYVFSGGTDTDGNGVEGKERGKFLTFLNGSFDVECVLQNRRSANRYRYGK